MKFIHNFILNSKFLEHTPFWCWYRFIIYDDTNITEDYLCDSFWYELNRVWWSMEYDAFMSNFNESDMFISSPDIPDTIYLTEEDFDTMMERLDTPSAPTPFMRQLLSRPTPWKDNESK